MSKLTPRLSFVQEEEEGSDNGSSSDHFSIVPPINRLSASAPFNLTTTTTSGIQMPPKPLSSLGNRSLSLNDAHPRPVLSTNNKPTLLAGGGVTAKAKARHNQSLQRRFSHNHNNRRLSHRSSSGGSTGGGSSGFFSSAIARLTGTTSSLDDDAARAVQSTVPSIFRGYVVGDSVLVNDHMVGWGANQVNKYGYPPGQGNNNGNGNAPEEQRGPYEYVLGKVTKVHFEEYSVYYTIAREDTGQGVRGEVGKKMKWIIGLVQDCCRYYMSNICSWMGWSSHSFYFHFDHRYRLYGTDTILRR
jgi:hypothetical protein